MATAFLKSAGGEISSLPGVVVNFAFETLATFAGDLLRLPAREAFFGGEAGLFGLAYFAGDALFLFGLFALTTEAGVFPLAGDRLFRALFPGDFAGETDGSFAGLFAGDLLPRGLLPGNFLADLAGDFFADLGLLAEDFLGVTFSVEGLLDSAEVKTTGLS